MRRWLWVRRLNSLSQTGCTGLGLLQGDQAWMLTNVNNVTQDQPNPRALRTSVHTVLANAAPHHATTAQLVSSEQFAGAARDEA
jgi:hypothetical protein